MKRRRIFELLSLAALAAGCGAARPAPTEPGDEGGFVSSTTALAELTWMLGAWLHDEEGERTEEHWSQLHERVFSGWGRTTRNGETVDLEHLLITADEDDVTYRAWPQGQRQTSFPLVLLNGERVEFANPEHDFPQRISYLRQGNELTARVVGTDEGEIRFFELTWQLQDLAEEDERQMTERELRRTTTVDASPAAVWEAWTTVEGVRGFFAPRANIELRRGGAFELLFDDEAPVGQQGSEGCTVVDFEPPRRLVFTWNFPPSLPTIRDAHTVVTLELEPNEQGGTSVTLTQTGWRAGADWNQGFTYFERAWGIVLVRLGQRFTTGPIDWSAS